MPGELSVNQTQRPEAVLTDGQWTTMTRLAEQNRAVSGGGEVGISDEAIERLVDAIEKRPLRIGTRAAGQLAMSGAGAINALGGRK